MKLKKVLCGVMALFMAVSSFPVYANEFSGKEIAVQSHLPQADGNILRMWYTNPGTQATWEESALVIGNGKTGAILLGQIGRDQIHFNEKTLWRGGPSASRPNYNGGNKKTPVTAEQLEELRQRADDHSTSVFPLGTSLDYVMGDGNGMGQYQDFGDLYLDFSKTGMTNDNIENYVRDLDMRTAVSSLDYDYDGVHYKREYFASHPDKAMVIRLTASEAGKISFTASTSVAAGLQTTATAANGRITLAGQVNDNQMKCEMQAQIVNEGGKLLSNNNGTVTVENADAVTIVLATDTDYKNEYPTYRGENPHEALTQAIDAAAEKSYEALLETHLEDYQELFDRMELSLGAKCPNVPTDVLMKNYREGDYDQAVEEMVYQFGRYLTIAGSREGDELPTNLCGIWMIGDSGKYWGGDFHFNVNVQMNYWPALATNLAECETVFNDFIYSLVEPGRVTAAMSAGVPTEEGTPIGEGNGFLVNTQNNPFGTTAPFGGQEYGWNIGGGSWALQNVYDYYLYTEDTSYLEEKIYPMLKEMATFWNKFLWYSEYQDRLVVGPSVSAEHGPTVNGTTYDQSIVWELYKMAIDASKVLGVDEEERAVWEEKQSQLNPIIIGKQGQVKEWFEESVLGKGQVDNLPETDVPHFGAGGSANQGSVHRHTSQLIGLYPGTLINKDTTEWMDAAVKSLEQRSLNGTGWSKAMKINMYARTGLAEDTYSMVRAMCAGDKNGIMNNLLDSHPPFQIDGNYGLTAGMTEMLLQSQLGYTQFLPALPSAWGEGHVEGLKSRGNFTIGETWSNAVAEEFTVRYDGSGSREFTGEYPNIADAKIYADGEKVTDIESEGSDKISFVAEEGVEYTIDVSGVNLDKIKEQAEAFLEEIHPDLGNVKEELENAADAELGAILGKAKYMDKVYREYLGAEEKIYYMTTQEGLSYSEIDSMYADMRAFKKALLANESDLETYKASTERFDEVKEILDAQMKNREVTFSKESGAISDGNNVLTLGKDNANYEIRYTLDGSTPCGTSELYEGEIVLDTGKNTKVKAALFLNKQRVSPVYSRQYSSKIVVSEARTQENDWGGGYVIASMIDGNPSTRWASKAPTGTVEFELILAKEYEMDRIYFDQFVSQRNENCDYEIQVLVDGEYQKVCEGTDLGRYKDVVNGSHAYNTVIFEPVTTSAVKVILKEGYVGEPSFFEVEPLMLGEKPEGEADATGLNEMIQRAEAVDRNSELYVNAADTLKACFEESLSDAKEAVSLTQEQMNNREEFLRDRYNRLGFGDVDKSGLEKLVAQAEREVNGDYTKNSLYLLKKELETAKAILEDEGANYAVVIKSMEALQQALKSLKTASRIVTVSADQLTGGSEWLLVKGYRVTEKDEAGELTYRFEGNKIEVPTVKADDHGIIHVVITSENGEVVYDEEIDTYADTRVEGTELFAAEFPQGIYTVSFERNGVRPGNTSRGWIEIGTLTITQSMEGNVDRTSLEAALEACEGLEESLYTEESWAVFQEAYEAAVALSQKEDRETCTAEMEDVSKKLTEAFEALEEVSIEPVETDKEDLAALIEYAKEAKEDTSYKYVVAKVRAMFEKALADAIIVNNTSAATQAEVDTAYEELLKTVHLLEFKGNMERLESLVVTAREESEVKYTPNSWTPFAEALQEAETILAEGNTLQAEIDAARTKLLNAIFGLREVPNKDKLNELLGRVKVMDLSAYSAETANAVKAAYAQAVAVFEDENADQKAVDAAAAALEEAVKAANAEAGDHTSDKSDKAASSDTGNKTTTAGKTASTGKTTSKTAGNTAAKTGDGTNTAVPVAVFLGSVLTAIAAWKKKAD